MNCRACRAARGDPQPVRRKPWQKQAPWEQAQPAKRKSRPKAPAAQVGQFQRRSQRMPAVLKDIAERVRMGTSAATQDPAVEAEQDRDEHMGEAINSAEVRERDPSAMADLRDRLKELGFASEAQSVEDSRQEVIAEQAAVQDTAQSDKLRAVHAQLLELGLEDQARA
eukprot:8846378-Alexandrium_andersonii.AAC.1